MKILVGYDGSECADAALDDLTQAELTASGEFHIMSMDGSQPVRPGSGRRAEFAGENHSWH
jgi:hypothetical protein